MTKYYLIDTWNGEGYTESGIIGQADDLGKAIEMAQDEFKDRYLSQYGEMTVNNQLHGGADTRQIIYTDQGIGNQDSGAIHILQTDDSSRGILIEPMTNSATALTGDVFTTDFKNILEDIDNDEDREGFLNDMLTEGNSGAHTDHGYYILYKL